jgi:alternate signal-mediated exported protein
MKKTTKGALAVGTATALLFGGAGTLAYWSDTGTVGGASISSGRLELANPLCGNWLLDAGGGPTAFNPATDAIVPGDVLTKDCTYDIVAVGNHLTADVTISTPSYTGANALTADLTAGGVFTINGLADTVITPADNGMVLAATVTLTFLTTSTNLTQNLAAVLDDVTVTATQTHA